jgi:hypothetical protein
VTRQPRQPGGERLESITNSGHIHGLSRRHR